MYLPFVSFVTSAFNAFAMSTVAVFNSFSFAAVKTKQELDKTRSLFNKLKFDSLISYYFLLPRQFTPFTFYVLFIFYMLFFF